MIINKDRHHFFSHVISFTLLELLVVIAVIAILSGMLLPAVMQVRKRAYVAKARAAISALEVAINMFKTDTGDYPDNIVSDLLTDPSKAGWHGPYMSFKEGEIDGGNFLDPWGKSYIYSKPGGGSRPYDLSSKGPNGKNDNGDKDDIISW